VLNEGSQNRDGFVFGSIAQRLRWQNRPKGLRESSSQSEKALESPESAWHGQSLLGLSLLENFDHSDLKAHRREIAMHYKPADKFGDRTPLKLVSYRILGVGHIAIAQSLQRRIAQ
jgi:hypothetical protein